MTFSNRSNNFHVNRKKTDLAARERATTEMAHQMNWQMPFAAAILPKIVIFFESFMSTFGVSVNILSSIRVNVRLREVPG